MQIHLVSSLTPDDESRLAPEMLAAIEHVLETMPVSYSVRIETGCGTAIHRNHQAASGEEDGRRDIGRSDFKVQRLVPRT